MMKVKKPRPISLERERKVICYLLLFSPVLAQFEPLVKQTHFADDFNRRIAEWCVDYFKEFQDSPGSNFTSLFTQYAEQEPEDGTIDEWEMKCKRLERDMRQLSDNPEYMNADAAIKFVETFVQERWLLKHSDDLAALAQARELTEAWDLLLKAPPSMGMSSARSLLDSSMIANSIIDDMYNESKELFQFPGAIGEMTNMELRRKSFLAILGAAKSGKSWFLIEAFYRAVKRRLRTLYVQCGDMTEAQFYARLFARCRMTPASVRPAELYRPILADCSANQTATCHLRKESDLISLDGFDTHEEAYEEGYRPCFDCFRRLRNVRSDKKLRKAHPLAFYLPEIKSQPAERKAELKALHSAQMGGGAWFSYTKLPLPCFKVITVGKNDMSPRLLNNILDDLERRLDWKADVIAIDYADLMRSDSNFKDNRHNEDDKWGALRKMAIVRDALVITATQTNRAGFEVVNVRPEHIGEDKRKLDHLTALLCISRHFKDVPNGMVRYTKNLSRDYEAIEDYQVAAFRQFQVGRPILSTGWMRAPDETYIKK